MPCVFFSGRIQMQELAISLNAKSRKPLYEQIYQHIRREIQSGRIPAGEKLPSSRRMSANLQVSRSTVDLAYEQLLSEGYIESVPYKGYYVCSLEGLCHMEFKEPEREERRQQEQEQYSYDFAVSGIDPDGFPYNLWRKISKEVLSEEDPQLYQLGEPQGEPGFREALADYLHYARGVNCTPEQIVVGAGSDYLLLLLHVLMDGRGRIAMENPTYCTAGHCLEAMGCEVKSVGMDESGMLVEERDKSGADVAYVMPSHQFPTGIVMPLRRRMKLLSWAAQKEGRYIIEDDYDSEFRYKGKPIPALQGFDTAGRVIYIGTFSKSVAPSIRISYMVLPPELLECYRKKGTLFSVTVSRVDQKIMEEFLRGGHFERHLNRMRAVYKAKHDLLLGRLRKMERICRVSGEQAGVHLVVHFVNGMTEQEALQRAARSGIRVYGISRYRMEGQKRYEGEAVLLGYATLKLDELERAADALEQAWSGT